MDMNSNAIFIGWNRAHSGREKQGMEVFNKFLGFLGEQQKAGNITSFTPVSLLVHGGDLNGFVLIQGENAKLQKLQCDEVFTDLLIQAQIQVGGMGVLAGFAGEPMMNRLQVAAKYW